MKRNYTAIFVLLFGLISCSNKEETKPLSEKEKTDNLYSVAEMELKFEKEKIGLISILKDIPYDSVYLILKEYLALKPSFFDSENESTENIISKISLKHNLSKRKIASIKFTYQYEMQTKEDIEEAFIESQTNYKPENN